MAHAGFSERKKLRSSIAAGLRISKPAAEELLRHVDIDPNARAEDLSIADWQRLAKDAVYFSYDTERSANMFSG